MTVRAHPTIGAGLAEYLARADAVILPRPLSESAAAVVVDPQQKLRVGVDLGTAYLRLLGHICNCTFGYLLILGSERKAVQDYISKSICIKVDR